MRTLILALAALAAAPAAAQGLQPSGSPIRPVATYSIVARDSATGEIGVAVQSHWFSVGSIVSWAEAGVGAVATQSFVEPAYGPLGLELMRLGRSGPEALRALVSTDKDSAVRQVAMIDAQGRVVNYTGHRAIAAAGGATGKGYAVQANMMDKPSVWPAMARAYETSKGDLAERLLAALEAAEREGGDIRGKQSAAIVIVAPTSTGRPWVDRRVDLRVEDHPNPIGELRRLVTLSRLYRKMNEGDEWMTKGDIAKATAAYEAALAVAPDKATNGEAAFWTGIGLVGGGKEAAAIPYLRRAYLVEPKWAELVKRLPAAGVLKDDKALIERLVRGMVGGG